MDDEGRGDREKDRYPCKAGERPDRSMRNDRCEKNKKKEGTTGRTVSDGVLFAVRRNKNKVKSEEKKGYPLVRDEE